MCWASSGKARLSFDEGQRGQYTKTAQGLIYAIVLPLTVPPSPSTALEILRRSLFRQAGRGDQCGWPSTPKLLRLLDVTATDCGQCSHRLTLGLQRLHWNVYVGRPKLSDSSGGLSLQTEGDKLPPHSAFWAAGSLWTYDLVFLFSVPRTPGRGGTSNYQQKDTDHFLPSFSREESNSRNRCVALR